jgi:hypothetical protein
MFATRLRIDELLATATRAKANAIVLLDALIELAYRRWWVPA